MMKKKRKYKNKKFQIIYECTNKENEIIESFENY